MSGMASAIKFYKLSKNVFSFSKVCHSMHQKHLLANNVLSARGTIACRQIMDARKEATDSSQELSEALISFKYMRLIKKAIREFGPFVEDNKRLSYLLKKAKEHNIPDDFLDFAMKMSVNDRAQVGLLEILFLHNCHLILQYEDVDLTMIKPHLLKICDENDAHLYQGDSKWPLHFEQMGLLFVKCDSANSLLGHTKDTQEMALKFGAKTVKNEIDPEGIPYWQFYCDPGNLHDVKRRLTNEDCEIEEAYVGYVPKRKVALPNPLKHTVHSIITELNKIPMIDNVFTNCM